MAAPPGRGVAPVALAPGQSLPPDALPAAEVARLLRQGVLAHPEPAADAAPAGLPPRRGPFCHDPADLVGKTVDQLRVMVGESGSSEYAGCDLLGLDESDLVNILTDDFEPAFVPAATVSKDRSRPDTALMRRAKRAAGGE